MKTSRSTRCGRESPLRARGGRGRAARPGPARELLDVEKHPRGARETEAELTIPATAFSRSRQSSRRARRRRPYSSSGRPPDVLAALGDKAHAKDLAREAGVPVLTGSAGDDQRDEALAAAAGRVGYPVMVKPSPAAAASACSGARAGRAARCARRRRDASRQHRSATSACFSSVWWSGPATSRADPRDTHGTVVALGERDARRSGAIRRCSRRRPRRRSTTPAQGDRRCRDRARAHSGYVNAGVEFAVKRRATFLFLEVNARLKVEHR